MENQPQDQQTQSQPVPEPAVQNSQPEQLPVESLPIPQPQSQEVQQPVPPAVPPAPPEAPKEETKWEKKQKEKKEVIIEYIRRFPFFKWAAAYAGIDADTLRNWRDADEDFSARCETAKAEALERLGKRATPDFMLKSADPESFKERKEVDVTSGGRPIPILPSIDVPTDNSDKKDTGTS